MRPKIWLSPPHMCGREREYVQQAFDENWIAPVGPFITRFEQELAKATNVSFAAALSSGTAAIHLALIILGIGRDDEVICSSFTFSGSCNPVRYQGATPVFVDSESETWNMDPSLMETAIKDRLEKTGKLPKAIIAVHLYGMPARIEEIMEIAARYKIPVIEDAAEALGSSRHGKPLGSYGDFGVLSFNGNKIITTSGGGALLSNNEEWIKKAMFLATQARDRAPHYEHSEVGYNYRLSNVCAGIGLGQLEVLDERVRVRREIFARYFRALSPLGFGFSAEPAGSLSNRWLTTMVCKTNNKRLAIASALEKLNIESRPLWKPMHLQPVFKGFPAYTNGISKALFETGICLPSGSSLAPEDQSFIISTIAEHA